MQKDTLQLDASMLAGRMKSHRPRPVHRVQPRGSAQHLRKLANADVWTPSNVQVVVSPAAPKQVACQKKELPKNTKSVVAKTQVQNAKPINTSHVQVQKPQTHHLDFEKNATEWVQSRKRTTKRKLCIKMRFNTNALLTAMAVMVFVFGLAAALHSFKVDRQITATVSAEAIGPNDVDETKPSQEDINNYQVSPDMPRYIRLPKFDVMARVKTVGVKDNGEIDTPTNIHDAAWYQDSVLPGSAGGASLIDGHVSGPTQPGVFKHLSSMSKGDIIEIEKGNGQKIIYKVVKTQVSDVAKVDMASLLLPVTPGKHGLNLISCTGKYNPQTKQFEQRALVYAEVVR